MKKFITPVLFACSLFASSSLQASDILPMLTSQSDFGGVGLWQTPTARMTQDGEFNFTISHVYPYTRGQVVMQMLPWVEFIARYTSISNILYGPNQQGYKDKSLDAKFQLWKESYYLPDIAVGFRDFGGTGLFSSEYLNATKRFGDLDVTFGIAWGEMIAAGDMTNPLCQLSSRFCRRSHSTGMGGTIGFGNFFSGQRASLFGGLEYQTPLQPLRLKVEYDPNDYQHEFKNNNQPQRSHVNVGAVYRVFDNLDVSVAYERGNKVMLGFNLRANLKSPATLPKSDLQPLPLKSPPSSYQRVNGPHLAKALQQYAGLKAERMYIKHDQLIVYGQQKRYRDYFVESQRAGYVLNNLTPTSINHFTLIDTAYQLPADAITLSREKINAYDEQRFIPFDTPQHELEQVESSTNTPDLTHLPPPVWQSQASPWQYYIKPKLQQSVGGPEEFILYQLLALAGATYQFNEHFLATGTLSYNLYDNMSRYKTISPSKLPRVRSDLRKYLITSRFGMHRLQLNYFNHYGLTWYGQVYAGYLESMFAGVGGEVLYRPHASRHAVGLDVNAVQKRGYPRLFGLKEYQTVTGHLSHYYQTPFYDILAKVKVGRYLAKDWGTTIDLSRRFKSGIVIGGFATFTNVSARQYGEGSFNKGFYLTIPFDIFTPTSTVEKATLSWIPLLRDGGQPLNRAYSLYDLTERHGIMDSR